MVDLDAAFAEVAERRANEAQAAAQQDHAQKSLWLAHHWPHRYERCATIGGRHVCRRCLWFYGVSFVTLFAAFAGISPWPEAWDNVMVWLLSVPATIEFVGGELGKWAYNPRRQAVVTAIVGLAVGRGFYVELSERWSFTFWGPVLVFGSIWLAVALFAFSRNKGQYVKT